MELAILGAVIGLGVGLGAPLIGKARGWIRNRLKGRTQQSRGRSSSTTRHIVCGMRGSSCLCHSADDEKDDRSSYIHGLQHVHKDLDDEDDLDMSSMSSNGRRTFGASPRWETTTMDTERSMEEMIMRSRNPRIQGLDTTETRSTPALFADEGVGVGLVDAEEADEAEEDAAAMATSQPSTRRMSLRQPNDRERLHQLELELAWIKGQRDEPLRPLPGHAGRRRSVPIVQTSHSLPAHFVEDRMSWAEQYLLGVQSLQNLSPSNQTLSQLMSDPQATVLPPQPNLRVRRRAPLLPPVEMPPPPKLDMTDQPETPRNQPRLPDSPSAFLPPQRDRLQESQPEGSRLAKEQKTPDRSLAQVPRPHSRLCLAMSAALILSVVTHLAILGVDD